MDLNPIIHPQVRLQIMTCLATVDKAEFNFLKNKLNLTDGNLASHLRKLEDEKYIEVSKDFVGRKPRTTYKITTVGRNELSNYITKLKDLIMNFSDKL